MPGFATSAGPVGALVAFATVSLLLSIFGGLSQCALTNPSEEVLEVICKVKHPAKYPVNMDVREMRLVLNEYRLQKRQGKETCDPAYDESFELLGELLSEQQLADVCSPRMYELVRAYHAKFVHFYLPETKRDQLIKQKAAFKASPIPQMLADFFILFVKQIEGTCKRHLLQELARGVLEEVLDDEDYELVGHAKCAHVRSSGPLHQLNRAGLSALGTSKPVKLAQLHVEARTGETDERNKLHVQVVQLDHRLMRLKTACERRFMPIYMEIFAPVIKLNNLGYIARAQTAAEDHELNNDQCFRRWFDIIQACEVLRDVEVLHDPAESGGFTATKPTETSKAELMGVKLISHWEARELRDLELELPYNPKPVDYPHKPIGLLATMWPSGDKEARHELDAFGRDVGRFVWWRTSKLLAWRNDVRRHLKSFFHKHNNQILDRDQSTALGRLTAFFDRHQLLLMTAALTLGIIFATHLLVALG